MIEPAAYIIAIMLGSFAVTKIWQALVRDFFAWTIWKEDNRHINERNKIHHPDEMAEWAYQMADAMMKRRSK